MKIAHFLISVGASRLLRFYFFYTVRQGVTSVNLEQLANRQTIFFNKLKENEQTRVEIRDLARCDISEAASLAFKYSKLVLASPTYNADIFPFMKEFINHLTERGYSNRTVAFIENGSWAPVAAKVMKSMLENSKNLSYTDTTVRINSALNKDGESAILNLAKELI